MWMFHCQGGHYGKYLQQKRGFYEKATRSPIRFNDDRWRSPCSLWGGLMTTVVMQVPNLITAINQ